MKDHVILCGSDGLATRVLEELHAIGEGVVAVSPDVGNPLAARAEQLGVEVVVGDYQDETVLANAGVADAEAVALLEPDDVGNLHAALASQDMGSGVRLVLRYFNLELGQKLEALFEDAEALSGSGIAAPAFAHAALHGNEAMPVEVRGHRLAVREERGAPGLLPVVVEEAPPEREAPEGPALAPRAYRRLARAGRLLLDRRTGLVLGLLASLVAVATVVFHLAANFAWIDSFYFTVTTITTVGYGDLNLLEQAPAVKLAGNALMLSGPVLFAILFAFLTDALVSARLATQIGEPPLPREGHAIVCGLGNVGFKVVQHLRAAGVPCIAVERDEGNPFLNSARTAGVPVRVADASLLETLSELNVEAASVVLALTDDDVANLETGVNARALRGDVRVVMRLFSAELADRMEGAFGISISRSLSALAAPAFVAAILRRRWLATVPLGARALAIAEGCAPREGTIEALEASAELRVLEAGGEWRPSPARALNAGERLLVLGSREGLRALA